MDKNNTNIMAIVEIKRLLQSILDPILENAQQEPQYSDFVNEFDAIEALVYSEFGRKHPLGKTFMEMMCSLYENKGDMESSMNDILAFEHHLWSLNSGDLNDA